MATQTSQQETAILSTGAVIAAHRHNGEGKHIAQPMDTVRVGFVGVGVKGSEHVANLLRIEGVELRAVCDIRDEACAAARREAVALGKRPPTAYTRGDPSSDKMRVLASTSSSLGYTPCLARAAGETS